MPKYNEKVSVEFEAKDWLTVRMALYEYAGGFIDKAMELLKEEDPNRLRVDALISITNEVSELAKTIKKAVNGEEEMENN